MIYVDLATGSIELLPLIKAQGVEAVREQLVFGDFMFEGKGPDGPIVIGVERKTLHDMMQCIHDARFAGHQMPGMKGLYHIRVLIVEGHWKPNDTSGLLMEGFKGGSAWGAFRGRQGRTMYAHLYRYLLSVSMSGFLVQYTRDPWHTALNVTEMFHYFQKPWDQHTSLQELHRIALPSLSGKPSLVRQWASCIDGVGTKLSDLAARHFGKPFRLANADEVEWMRIPGIGAGLAQKIYRQIQGIRP